MDSLILPYIRDPLYRFATWIILLQLAFILGAALIAALIRWLKPQWDEKRYREESIARQAILSLLSEREQNEEERSTIELFEEISIRSIINAFEQIVTRVSDIEQRRLRGSLIALGIESYALKLSTSWLWWRRLEGVLLLRSVGAETSEEALVERLMDQHPSVSFYAAWALARVSPIRGLEELIPYIESETTSDDLSSHRNRKGKRRESLYLSFSQQVTLLKELQLEYLSDEELEAIFARLNDSLKPVIIEALIQSGRGRALPLIRLGINSVNDEVRIASFKAAVTSKLSLSEDELKRGLRDPVWPVRAQAVKAVGALRVLNLIPQLTHCLSDEQWWVRNNSAHTLVQLGATGIEALNYVSQFGSDRFARDISRLVLSEVIMASNPIAMSVLEAPQVSPQGQEPSSQGRLTYLQGERPSSLLTTELTAITQINK